ncbi:sugar phosphate nucleotidyltransferase [Natronosalvus halobius]|uniref:sugar phosphate nucleotidyltransferase n=1 Tax=Natronosalvus halobius TaxID=2953746 RepID=UPI00209FE774|nr:sugar phosphate nucleotidyltransferase [Natronosalvus halobius]USZ71271.1 sugar phosphate nucleotidyltransferase [Natronosalvus halobius]
MTERSAIVLAAGEGSRLRPLTKHRPKPMLPAATKPILEHVFDALIDAGVTEITTVVGYQRNRVQSHFGPTYRNVPIRYVKQEKLLGSGHALLAAEDAHRDHRGPTLVVYGDQLVDGDIVADVLESHDEGSVATLGLIPTDDVGEYGGVLTDDGEVIEIVERPLDDREYTLNAGVYVFDERIFEAIRGVDPRVGEQSLIDGISSLIGDETASVQGVVSDGLWVDATYPWDLLTIAEDLLASGGVESQVSADAYVHESATIVDPVVVPADCVVGAGSVVGPNVCLGENVTVGSNVSLTHAVVDADTRIEDGATVRDCVTGRGARIGPGSTVVGGPSDVQINDSVHRDVDFGALFADHAHDEGGSTFAPGVIVGADAYVQAGSTLRGTIEDDVEVRS